MAKTQKQPTFEQKLDELEQIIDSLEQGEMPLDKAIATYKRGVELTCELKTQLEGAREQLKVLNTSDASDDKPESNSSDAE